MFKIYFIGGNTFTFEGTEEAVLNHTVKALKHSLCREAIVTNAKTGWVLYTVTK